MSNSVANVTCDKCANIFLGTLDGLFDVCKIYVAICPACESKVTLIAHGAFIDTPTPKGAVIITPVDRA